MTIQQLTEFGKALRIARLNNGMKLKDMAEIAEVSSAHMSSIEMGRKEVSGSIVEKLANALRLNHEEKEDLVMMAMRSNKKVRIDLDAANDSGLEAATLFARHFSDLSPEALDRITSVVKEEIKKNSKEETTM